MFDDGSSSPLLGHLPQIRRARDYRLYTAGGKRIVDLWQCGGHALLGHTVPHQLRELKNTAARGLAAPLPHHNGNKLERAAGRIFPGRVLRMYRDRKSLETAFAEAGFENPSQLCFPDPGLGHVSSHHSISLWRPFLDTYCDACSSADILLPVFPCAWTGSPKILLLEKAVSERFPPSDLVSPVILSVFIASVYGLIRFSGEGAADYGSLEKELAGTPWRRRGIYLFRQDMDNAAGEKLFFRFLEQGFLFPPSVNLPLILPARKEALSPGELGALVELLKNPEG